MSNDEIAMNAEADLMDIKPRRKDRVLFFSF